MRLEAGLCLYGHDLSEEINPVEANLKWAIAKKRREEGGFNLFLSLTRIPIWQIPQPADLG